MADVQLNAVIDEHLDSFRPGDSFLDADQSTGIVGTLDGDITDSAEDEVLESSSGGDLSTNDSATTEVKQDSKAGHKDGDSTDKEQNIREDNRDDDLHKGDDEDTLADDNDDCTAGGNHCLERLDGDSNETANNLTAATEDDDYSQLEEESDTEVESGQRNGGEIGEKLDLDDGWITEPEDAKLARSAASFRFLWRKACRTMRRRPREFMFHVFMGYVSACVIWGFLFLLLGNNRSTALKYEGIMRARVVSEDAVFFEGVVVSGESTTPKDVEAGVRRFLELTLGT